ncbi:glycoside hydrolase [Xylariaceae sp. FL0255]|nr:glycoside hydrolase [Xylariaceae sp. FL0255]
MILRRRSFILVAGLLITATLWLIWPLRDIYGEYGEDVSAIYQIDRSPSFWGNLPTKFPPESVQPIPKGRPVKYPKVQTSFPQESEAARDIREKRQHAVRDAFLRCWAAYKKHAWLSDEIAPTTGGRKDPFGGWGATLVDSLDTLWIMGVRGSEFDEAVAAAASIDFEHTNLKEINVFETNIRYLGGFLSAFDMSGDIRLLHKAVEVGEMLYHAFDTPNRMPITRWDPRGAIGGIEQEAGSPLLAEIGSFSMEFSRLSLLTGDPKWFDAVQRITDEMQRQQAMTQIPGLWPMSVDARRLNFATGSVFTLSSMADSAYEYLPKMSALLGGKVKMYQTMYELAIEAAKRHNLLFRPMTPTNEDILITGQLHTKEEFGRVLIDLEPQGQHLGCYLGGLVAFGSKLFSRSSDMAVATKLVDGCIWAYKALPHGIMPETFTVKPCPSGTSCEWDENIWQHEISTIHGGPAGNLPPAGPIIETERLPRGFTSIPDTRYILRPEAIESIFVLYRITGREDLLNTAWDMFQAISNDTRTEFANAAVWDVTIAAEDELQKYNSMESFWMGETLKYFYLIFSDPSLISLDEFVFNTEAHPFRRLLR